MVAQSSAPKGGPLDNPFPIFPVASLRDIAPEILDKTVSTEAVRKLDALLVDHVRKAADGGRVGVAIPVRGDYGTGKSHLLLFAQARLRKAWPEGAAEVVVLSVASTETPLHEWYLTMVAPRLDELDLPSVFTRLLAAAAYLVADQVTLTADVAKSIRHDPLEVYEALREGLLSRTHVERALLGAVAAITPGGSEELRSVLAALAWPRRRQAALRWLAGRTLDPAEREQLGVARDLDAQADATSALVAFAGATGRGGGLFALMIDEFEHLMAEDKRTGTHRNATAVKRLLEGMCSMGAVVVVAGHWRAWEQLPDFKARFGSQTQVDLPELDARETAKLALGYAPTWAKRLDQAAMHAMAEAGERNLRSILSLMHQVHADTAGGTGPIGVAEVEAAAETRRRLAVKAGRPDAVIEEAIRAAGGSVARNEALFGKLRFDLAARRDGVLRLVADVRHVATTAELSRRLEDMSIAVGTLRARHPLARGLLIVSGAIDRATLALLDDVDGVDALRGEGPGWEAPLREAVAAAMQTEPSADEGDPFSDERGRERLREVRIGHAQAAEATRLRVEELDFGESERAAALKTTTREAAPTAPKSVYGPDTDVLDSFTESMLAQKPTLLRFFIFNSHVRMPAVAISSAFFSVLFFLLASHKIEQLLYVIMPGRTPEYLDQMYMSTSIIFEILFIFFILYLFLYSFRLTKLYFYEKSCYIRFLRWGRQLLEELLVSGAPSNELLRIKNRLVDAPDNYGGFERAIHLAVPEISALAARADREVP